MVKPLTEQVACAWLMDTAAGVPADQAIVELGVFRGGSLRYLCNGSRLGVDAPVFGIDPWASQPDVYADRPKLIRRYGPENEAFAAANAPDATLIKATAVDAAADWDGPKVGLLFIDAIHKEPNVLADFTAWRPHLAPGAVVAFDDHCERFDGVRTAVAKLVKSRKIRAITMVGSRLATSRTP